MSRILGIAGASRSGKDTASHFIFANELKKLDIIDKFEMDEEGNLYVNHDGDQESGLEPGMAKINLCSKDPVFVNYLQQVVWPHIKLYAFADLLKFMAVHMYGLRPEQVYGDTKEKNSPTQYTYKQIKVIVPARIFPRQINSLDTVLTARQFLQYLSDTLRELNDNCFVDPVVNQLNNEQVPFSIITDVRRKVEVERIKAMGGKVLYLTRRPEKDKHRIENEFVDIKKPEEYFDIVVNNTDMTLAEKNIEIYTQLRSIGWLGV